MHTRNVKKNCFILDAKIRDKIHYTVCETCEHYSEDRVYDHIASLLHLLILPWRYDHLYPSPRDPYDSEDRRDTDSVGDDIRDESSCW